MAEPRGHLVKGVEETASECLVAPLGLSVRKDADDARRQLSALGLANEAPERWCPWERRARVLPPHIGRAAATIVVLMLRGTLLLWGGGSGAAVGGALIGSATIAAMGVVAIVIGLSIIVHETAHGVVFRALAPSESAIVIVEGCNAALLRRALPGYRELLVVCAGPCAPAILALALVPLGASSWLIPAVGAVVALGHLATLAIPIGDGANLRAALGR